MKNIKIYLSIIFLLVTSGNYLVAQRNKTPKESSLQIQYKSAKVLFDEGKYSLAMEAMKSLNQFQEDNPYLEYASFHFGLSAHYLDQYAVAKNMFLQIIQKYPKWSKINDVYFWLAKTYFEQGYYVQGMGALKEIKKNQGNTKSLQENAAAMKKYYLRKAKSQENLEVLYQNYPEDKDIGEALANAIILKPYKEQKHQLLDSLVQAFELDTEKFVTVTQESSIKKEVYRVGVFFPFTYNHLSAGTRQQSNQLVLDLYNGIRLAAEDLKKENINIEVYAYDTQRDSVTTAKLLTSPELKTMDVIIGPLLANTSPMVSAFSLENRINMFNPVSSNPQVIGDNPFSFLIRPSVETQARKAAAFALDSLARSMPVIIYGPGIQDSLEAVSYKNTYDKEFLTGESVMQKFLPEESASIQNMIHELDSLGTIGHIYVASDNELIVSNTLGGILKTGHQIPVFGHENWFQIATITTEQLENIGVMLMAPRFRYHQDAITEFRTNYTRRFNTLPSEFCYEGYDAMYFLGKTLFKYGIYFQKFFEEDETFPSRFHMGYNYYNANDNQVVPIITFKDSELSIVNQPVKTVH